MKKIKYFLTLFSIFLTPIASSDSPTDYAHKVDVLYKTLNITSAIFCVLIVGAFLFFAIKFRRKSEKEFGHATKSHNAILEFSWSFIPFIIFVVAFIWGWVLFYEMNRAPKDSLEVHVYGQMWSWEFIYKNNRKVSSEFYVPVNQSVKLIMTSRDVIHSFFIPSFRIKQDVLPGRYTSLWFKATKIGSYNIFCTEFCGSGHSKMLAKVHVVSEKDWVNWISTDPYKGLNLSDIGKKVFKGRCTVCHNPTTEKLIGPGLAQLYGTKREFNNASSLIVDENYLRESILNPEKKIVKGYQNQMTPFAGILSEDELLGLIEYIKSLK